ncbi:MAG: Crp/Fnr family transcriptional regulator [Myxococcales bacterium]|nr:Crp/Fnr family transcriptional regulator [Myxococcales bacterium]
MRESATHLRLVMEMTQAPDRPAYPAACPDCPGARLAVLEPLVGATKEACAFSTVHLASRLPIPPSWASFGIALIRRGVLIRQRVDDDGHATAIDAAGPGCLVPLDELEGHGYAIGDTIVCMCPRSRLDEALSGASVAQDLLDLHRSAIRRVERLAEARGASSGVRKVARCLVVLAETLSPPRVRDDLPLGFQQRDLAALIGMRHESVCRALGVLERDGCVTRGGNGSIDALVVESLRAV